MYSVEEETTPAEWTSDAEVLSLPRWTTFSEIQFREMLPIKETRGRPKKENERSEYQDRGGHFFEYLIKPDTPTVLVNYLKRLQIFVKLTTVKLIQEKPTEE